MTQLWLVTLPEKANKQEELKQSLASVEGKYFSFEIPPMAIGSLDSLMALTDDLVKINLQVEVKTIFQVFISRVARSI